ncbi:nuclear transport factor 2 family protein [Halorussus salinisoli]|uniref:nuclear transport factor 2 family protein n=1 Tax=Halorussus salinisoli TaxID=2558242 RepID=UPI0010C1DB95|nr:nuclear transport factor 2 family protein [Halorussus salinisoli]
MQDDELTRTEFREYFTELYEASPDARIEEKRVLPSHDGTAVKWTFHGIHEGGLRRRQHVVKISGTDERLPSR